jgi:SpoVK/Ycf46/Vps4 family AAA+-type ATPase
MFVPPPDHAARAAILRVLLAGKPVADLDLELIAKKTEHFSGADLKAAIDVAIEAKLTAAMRDGIPRPLTTKDLLAAVAAIKPSTRDWFSSAKNYALYANQGGTYDEVLKYLEKR